MLHAYPNTAMPGPKQASAPPRLPSIGRAAKRLVTIAISVAAVGFVAFALHSSWNEFSKIVVEPGLVTAIGLLGILYGACFYILFASWYITLRRHTPIAVPVRAAAYAYCISNIAKYLPGNVFHFAGRQILGSRLGWSHKAIARATILEIAAIVGGICGILLLMAAFGPIRAVDSLFYGNWTPATETVRIGAFVAMGIAIPIFIVLSRLRVFKRLFGVTAGTILVALTLCALFFTLYTAIAIAFAGQLAIGSETPAAMSIAVAYLLAWLVGFVMPGAPGGLGVRESVLVLLLTTTNDMTAAAALGLALGMRLISTLGDLVAAASAFVVGRRTATAHGAGRPGNSDG